MLGAIVNTLTVIAGSAIGLFCKKGIPQKYADRIMQAIALATIVIGIQGALETESVIILIIALVLGVALGTWLDIDGKLNRLGSLADRLFPHKEGSPSAAAGFVAASLLMCVGTMTIVGAIKAGIQGDNTLLFTKSVMDFISGIFLTVSLGFGVMLSAVTILVLEGGIALLASLLSPIFTEAIILSISSCGSVLILALGLDILGVVKLKVADFLPAIVFAPIITAIVSLF